MFAIEHLLSIIDLLFFSGVWSTVLSVSFIVLSLILVSYEKYGIEYFLLAIATLGLQYFTEVQPITFIWNHPVEALTYGGSYLAIGGIYSIIKYWTFVREVLKEVQELKVKFIAHYDLPITVTDEIPEDCKSEWKWKLKVEMTSINGCEFINGGISPANQKARLTNWIAFWPFSAIGLFLADPIKHGIILIRKLLTEIYELTFTRLVKRYIHPSDIS